MTDWLYPLRAVYRPLDARYADARISDVSLAAVMSHAAAKFCGCGIEAETACKGCGIPLCDDCGQRCVDCHQPICDVCSTHCENCGECICEGCKLMGYINGLAYPFCESCYGDLDPMEDDNHANNG